MILRRKHEFLVDPDLKLFEATLVGQIIIEREHGLLDHGLLSLHLLGRVCPFVCALCNHFGRLLGYGGLLLIVTEDLRR